jgi:hypothetical protein
MKLKATCLKDPTHDRFITVAHVMEEWVVDAEGEFVEKHLTLETTHGPDVDNLWECAVCGFDAKAERVP